MGEVKSVPITSENWYKYNFCGCCGRQFDGPSDLIWCKDCRAHIDPNPSSACDRTWFAQFGTECPFAPGPNGGKRRAA
jgi:hypothetical protein